MAEVQVATAGDLETQPPLPGVYLKLAGKVWGSGFRVLGFRGLGFTFIRSSPEKLGVQGLGFRGLGFRVGFHPKLAGIVAVFGTGFAACRGLDGNRNMASRSKPWLQPLTS